MLYRTEQGRIWDPTVIKWHHTYYMFTMYYEKGDAQSYACRLATSGDGAHWVDRGSVVTDDRPVFKCGVFRAGDRFFMNWGSSDDVENDAMGYAESDDLVHWTKTGRDTPDARWYEPHARWDHMYCRESERGGYLGCIVAVPKDGGLCGLRRSDDGRAWTSCPPPAMDWAHAEPTREMEVGGLEKLGDRWYLMGGICAPYNGHYGYGAYVFASEREDGPFRPCAQNRLCGHSGVPGEIFMSCLPCFVHDYDDPTAPLLCSSSVYHRWDDDQNLCWALPLSLVSRDADGLHLDWWRGNDALRGEALPCPETAASASEALPPYQLTDAFAAAPLTSFRAEDGLWLEGALTAEPRPGRGEVRSNLWRPCAAGFAFDGEAVAVEIGDPRYAHAWFGGWDGRAFTPFDDSRPDDATRTHILPAQPTRFRLLVQYGVGVLFLDDRLVQVFVCKTPPTGVSLFAKNADVRVDGLRAYRLR